MWKVTCFLPQYVASIDSIQRTTGGLLTQGEWLKVSYTLRKRKPKFPSYSQRLIQQRGR